MNEPVIKVLVVEDDAEIAKLEQTVLSQAGYKSHLVGSANDALLSLTDFKPDIVLLDIGLPDGSGLDLCEQIADRVDAFILMVSGRSDEESKLTSLGLGADDYITKPFSPSELIARITSFLRRRDKLRARSADGTLTLGNITLVRDRHTLERDSKSVPLTALEFRLLWFLGEAEGTLLTRAQILERVWNDTSGVPTRVVDVHVAALRKKLNEIEATAQIASVRGIGYRLDA